MLPEHCDNRQGARGRVSVVMPAFEVAAFVEEAARSVLEQDWPSIELIAIDDGSTDATGDLLQTLAARPRPPSRMMRAIRQPHAGAAAARNTGLDAASGDFIAFIDADDRWHPTLLSSLLRMLASDTTVDLIFPRIRYIDESGAEIGIESRVAKRRYDAADLLVANPVHSATGVLIRRDAALAVGRFDETLTSCVDLDFFVRIGMARPRNIAATTAVLVDYRRREGQITGDWRRMQGNWKRVLEKSLAGGLVLSRSQLRKAHANWGLYCATLAYKAGDHRAARRLIAGVWRDNPGFALRDRHARMRTLASIASLLPAQLHDRLRAEVNALRNKLGLDWS